MGLIFGPNSDIVKDVKNLYQLLLCQIRDIDSMSRGNAMALTRRYSVPYTVRTSRNPDKGFAIKRLVVCIGWDLEPLDLLNGLALGCLQPSLDVWGSYGFECCVR